MLVADTYLGNRKDPGVAERLETAEPLCISVDDAERRRSRFRTTTECGREVGVVLGRDLRDGDLLEADGTTILVRLEPVEAVVLDFDGTDVSPTTAIEVGHVVGNRHWDLVVRDNEVIFPAVEEADRLAAAVEPLLNAGVRLSHQSVSPTLIDAGGEGVPGNHSHHHPHPSGDGYDHHEDLDPNAESSRPEIDE